MRTRWNAARLLQTTESAGTGGQRSRTRRIAAGGQRSRIRHIAAGGQRSRIRHIAAGGIRRGIRRVGILCATLLGLQFLTMPLLAMSLMEMPSQSVRFQTQSPLSRVVQVCRPSSRLLPDHLLSGGWTLDLRVNALSVPKITVDPDCLSPASAKEVVLWGTVSRAKGQRIVVFARDGQEVLCRTEVKKTKGKADYRLRIPEEKVRSNMNRKRELLVYVQSRPASGIAASKKVRAIISCDRFLKVQSIAAPARITLTNLKGTVRIKAAASSGLKMQYRSTRPQIVSVDKKGKLVRKRNGKAVIIVTQKGNRTYLPVTKKIAVTSRTSTRGEQIDGAVNWAIRIAGDNSFAYGTGRGAHNYGCYYCGTNYGPRRHMKPGAKYRKTYCCNPFVHAAYAHGARHPKMLRACRAGSGIGMGKWTFYRYGCWKCVGKPSYGTLKKGDVLVKRTHVAMYVGKQRLAEAATGNWSAGSIAVKHMSKSRYRGFSFVMRYTGY